MAKPINMPQVGQDLETAVILEWCVKENDVIKKGDIIAVVDSDKASFEVECYESGVVLKLLFEAGDEAKVLEPIAYIGEVGEVYEESGDTSYGSDSGSSAIPEPEVNNETSEHTPGKILTTPVVKRLAKENDIDLSEVKGTGPNRRIVKKDVLKIIEAKSSNSKNDDESKIDTKNLAENKDQVIPFTKMRQTIANRLLESKQKIPHFYLFLDVDVTDMLQWRQKKNSENKKENKISVNDILIAVAAKALRKYPKMNVHIEDTQLTIKQDINIGIAVSVEDGLLVPVLEKADEKSLNEITKMSKEFALSAQKGILKSSALGTFTISNLGMHSIDKFIPIINLPEACILGVGQVTQKLVPLLDSTYGIRNIFTLTLACDHRAIDGALGAQFLNEIKNILEEVGLPEIS